jgi:Rhs element Vgr protein
MYSNLTWELDFSINGINDTINILTIDGNMELSSYYSFTVTFLYALSGNLEAQDVLNQSANIYFGEYENYEGTANPTIYGIITDFVLEDTVDQYGQYKVTLRPYASWMLNTKHTQVFTGNSVQLIVELITAPYNITPVFDFYLPENINNPPLIDFVFQYEETDANFIARLLEKYGMFFYFEPGTSGEQMVITDSSLNLTANPFVPVFNYQKNPNIQSQNTVFNIFTSLIKTYTPPPSEVIVRSYDYNLSTKKIAHAVTSTQRGSSSSNSTASSSTASSSSSTSANANQATASQNVISTTVDNKAPTASQNAVKGYVVEHWSCDIVTQDGIKNLSQIIMGSYKAKAEVITMQTLANYLMPGQTIQVQNHPQQSININYVITAVSYAINISQAQCAQLSIDASFGDETFVCTVTAIPASTPYYRGLVTPINKISGFIPAMISGSLNTKGTVELDSNGQYCITIPVAEANQSATEQQATSKWIRKMESALFNKTGIYYPLKIGTEVLLSFQDGHPDVPIILGAVINSENPSYVTASNANVASTILTPVQAEALDLIAMNQSAISKLVTQQTAAARATANNTDNAGKDLNELNGTLSVNSTWNPGEFSTHYDGTPGDSALTITYPNGSYYTATQSAIIKSESTDSYSINLGNSYNTSLGNKYNITKGNSVNMTEGNSSNKTFGNTNNFTKGDLHNITIGKEFNHTFATQFNMTMDNQNNLTVGNQLSLTLGPANTISALEGSYLFLGINIMATMGMQLGFNYGFRQEIGELEETRIFPVTVHESPASHTMMAADSVVEVNPGMITLTTAGTIIITASAVIINGELITQDAGIVSTESGVNNTAAGLTSTEGEVLQT